ncbi:MAG TPA: hypothetical protein VKA70_18250 [Blastocatellia bacterium]|nr:hypothetical protein [Blastocatellia bacterium]
MNDTAETFKRYRQEHAQLYAPEASESSAWLIADDVKESYSPRSVARRKRERKRRDKQAQKESLAHAPEPQPSMMADLSTGDLLGIEGWLHQAYSTGAVLATEEVEAAPELEAADPAQRIEISPSQVNCRIDLFEDQSFQVSAPEAKKVHMIWRSRPDERLQRVEMDYKDRGIFNTAVSISDGEHLFAYEVDGFVRPDPRHSQRLAIGPDGLFAPLSLLRNAAELVLKNHGGEPAIIDLEPAAQWIVAEKGLRLLPGESVRTMTRLLPPLMSAGKNEAGLSVRLRGRGGNGAVASARLEALAETGGAIPEVTCSPRELGWVFQGRERLEINVEVMRRGRGRLSGMIFLPASKEIADFQLEAEADNPRFSHTFMVDSLTLPYRTNGSLSITVVTDSYLSNHRLSQIELPYKFVYLKKSLPALAYGKVQKGLSRVLRLEVARSDGEEINLEVVVPKPATHYLEPYRARPGIFSFRLDTQRMDVGTVVSEVVDLIDVSSGLRDQIKVVAEVIGSAHGL